MDVGLPLAAVRGQLAVVRGRGGLVGLFHFEEHRGRGAVLHGPGRETTQGEKGRVATDTVHEGEDSVEATVFRLPGERLLGLKARCL